MSDSSKDHSPDGWFLVRLLIKSNTSSADITDGAIFHEDGTIFAEVRVPTILTNWQLRVGLYKTADYSPQTPLETPEDGYYIHNFQIFKYSDGFPSKNEQLKSGTVIGGDYVKTGLIKSSNWAGDITASPDAGTAIDLDSGILKMRYSGNEIFSLDSTNTSANIAG